MFHIVTREAGPTKPGWFSLRLGWERAGLVSAMDGYHKAEQGTAGLVWKESVQSLPGGSELILALFSNIPNRSTFVCPYCGARNLDQQELVKHCMENHRNDPNKVVSTGTGWFCAA